MFSSTFLASLQLVFDGRKPWRSCWYRVSYIIATVQHRSVLPGCWLFFIIHELSRTSWGWDVNGTASCSSGETICWASLWSGCAACGAFGVESEAACPLTFRASSRCEPRSLGLHGFGVRDLALAIELDRLLLGVKGASWDACAPPNTFCVWCRCWLSLKDWLMVVWCCSRCWGETWAWTYYATSSRESFSCCTACGISI